ncbi:MAG TPA: VanZ family protein [Usitatibacteraceae bacterium]
MSAQNSTLRRLWLIGGIAILLLLWVLSLIPQPPTFGVKNEDKLFHAVAYGGTMWWWGQYWPALRRRFQLAIVFTLMGIAVEFIQGWTGWRTFDTHDMVANGIGVLLGWAMVQSPAGSLLSYLDDAMRRRAEKPGR